MKRLNLKLRFINKATLVPMVLNVIAFIYLVLGLFNVVPRVSEETVSQVICALIDLLFLLGILVDPTTVGVYDSERAMQYEMPNKPELPVDHWETLDETAEGGEQDG